MGFPFLPIIMFILLGAIAILFIFGLVQYTKAHKLRVRDPMDKEHYVTDYLMVEYLNKETNERRWKSVFWQKRYDVEVPPASALDVGLKGKKHAECYRVSEGQHCWITDKGITIKERKNEHGVSEWMIVDVQLDGKEKIIDTFKPYTVTQRQEIVNQHKKAIEISRQKGWNAEKVITVVSIVTLSLIIIIALVFAKDIWQGLNEAQAHITENLRIQNEISANLALVTRSLGYNISDKEVKISQVPKSQDSNLIISTNETQPI